MVHSNILRFRLSYWCMSLHELIHQVVWNLRESMSDIWVEWNSIHTFFLHILWELIHALFCGSISIIVIFFFILHHCRELDFLWMDHLKGGDIVH